MYFLPLQLAKGLSGHSRTSPKAASVLFLKEVCERVCVGSGAGVGGEGWVPST